MVEEDNPYEGDSYFLGDIRPYRELDWILEAL